MRNQISVLMFSPLSPQMHMQQGTLLGPQGPETLGSHHLEEGCDVGRAFLS